MFDYSYSTILSAIWFKVARFKPIQSSTCQKDKNKQLEREMKNLFILSVIAAAFLFMNCTQTFAQPGPDHAKKGPGFNKGMMLKKHMGKLMKEMEFTDQQKSDIKALRLANQKKNIDLKASLKKIKLENVEMLNSGKFDKEIYLKSVEQSNKILGEMKYNAAVVKTKIFDLLTDKQKQIWIKHAGNLFELKESIKDRIQKRFHR